jgi:LysM repeat protein
MQKKLFIYGLLIVSCASPNNPTPNVSLQIYQTRTPALTPTPNILVVIETPLSTNTPMVYIIESGDTISEIAEKFKISQADLRAANPDVNPNALVIGETLIIPDPSAIIAAASTPTPLPAPITQAVCYPSADSGLHCFALIQNNTETIFENVSAQINLLDGNNQVITSQIASTILDIIPANSSLPVYTFFPSINIKVTPQVQLLSAFQNNSDNYLPAIINNSVAEITGKHAQVSGQIYLPAESKAATQAWVAAVAYDKNGTVVGVKRWEGGVIQPGEMTPFNFSVSSLGIDIEAVEFFIQAK